MREKSGYMYNLMNLATDIYKIKTGKGSENGLRNIYSFDRQQDGICGYYRPDTEGGQQVRYE